MLEDKKITYALKCENCAAPLSIILEATSIKCEYCGSINKTDGYSIMKNVEAGTKVSNTPIINAKDTDWTWIILIWVFAALVWIVYWIKTS